MVRGENVTIIDRGPEVHLRSWFNDPYNDAISAARTCYSSRVIEPDEVTEQQRENIGPLTFEGGHHTVYQHATFEFGLSGISRQLVWAFLHGFPYYNTEQQSQRYVRLNEITAHVPPTLQGREREIFCASIERSWRAYRGLTEYLTPVTQRILSDLWRLPTRKSTAFGKNIAREAGKRAIETARYVIPIACHTAMVYTVSGLVLHRLRRMVRVGDVPREAAEVVGRMVEAVERVDTDFFKRIGEPPRAFEEVIENQIAPPGVGDAGGAETFDKSLNGCSSRLIDYSIRAPEVIADAIRHVLGRFDLDDDAALQIALDPAKNKYRVDTLNISTHTPIMRTLAHAHYTFRKKLSHTADSQDQRHRTVPGSRPLLSRTVPGHVDVIEPEMIRDNPECHALFSDAMGEGVARTRSASHRRRRARARALRHSQRGSGSIRRVGCVARPSPQMDDANLFERAARNLAGVDGRDQTSRCRAPEPHSPHRAAVFRAHGSREPALHRRLALLWGSGMEVVPASRAGHLIPELTAPALALMLGFALLGPADASAEEPDLLAGESFGFAYGVASPHSGPTLIAAHWPPAKADAASRDPFGVTLLAAHWPPAKADAASRDPFGVTLLAAHWPPAKADAASRDPFGVTLLAAHWPPAKADAASRDPFGVTLLAAHWPPAKADAASRDPFGGHAPCCALASGQS